MLSVNIYFNFFQKLHHLSLDSLKIPMLPLRECITTWPHMTTLNLSGVLNSKQYGDVIIAIAENMPNLQSLDISRSAIKPGWIESLIPAKQNQRRGCRNLTHLNMKDCAYVTVKLLRAILEGLPNLEVLNHALMIDALVDSAKSTNNLVQSLTFITGGFTFDSHWTTSPIQNLDKISELDIIMVNNSEQFWARLLSQLKNVKQLTVTCLSEADHALIKILRCSRGSLEHLSVLGDFKGYTINDITKACPKLVELKIRLSDHPIPSETIVDKPASLISLRKLNIQIADIQTCSRETLLSLLKSHQLKELYLLEVEAMSNEVVFQYLAWCKKNNSTKIWKIVIDRCNNITEAPFVRWLSMRNCMLEYIHLQCPHVNSKNLIKAGTLYPNSLYLFAN